MIKKEDSEKKKEKTRNRIKSKSYSNSSSSYSGDRREKKKDTYYKTENNPKSKTNLGQNNPYMMNYYFQYPTHFYPPMQK